MSEAHPEVLNMFPAFNGLTQQEIMSSRPLHLHITMFMRALENFVLSLNDKEKITEYLLNLGGRHRSLKMDHFDVCLFIIQLHLL